MTDSTNAIRRVIPGALRDLTRAMPGHTTPLLAAADRCETEGSRAAARDAREAARDARAAAARAAASDVDDGAFAAAAAASSIMWACEAAEAAAPGGHRSVGDARRRAAIEDAERHVSDALAMARAAYRYAWGRDWDAEAVTA